MKFNTILFALSAFAAVASAVEIPGVPVTPDLTTPVGKVLKRVDLGNTVGNTVGNVGNIVGSPLGAVGNPLSGSGVSKRGLVAVDARVAVYVKAIIAAFAKIEANVIAQIVEAVVLPENLESLCHGTIADIKAYVLASVNVDLHAIVEAAVRAHIGVDVADVISVNADIVADISVDVAVHVNALIVAALKHAIVNVHGACGIADDVLRLIADLEGTVNTILAQNHVQELVENATKNVQA
ncbi:hypothetical protein BGX20_000082 [Mortierella sp. AD010]|nr:hypothetical protein BGX20_000082 [Mortierella sp. AD010]